MQNKSGNGLRPLLAVAIKTANWIVVGIIQCQTEAILLNSTDDCIGGICVRVCARFDKFKTKTIVFNCRCLSFCILKLLVEIQWSSYLHQSVCGCFSFSTIMFMPIAHVRWMVLRSLCKRASSSWKYQRERGCVHDKILQNDFFLPTFVGKSYESTAQMWSTQYHASRYAERDVFCRNVVSACVRVFVSARVRIRWGNGSRNRTIEIKWQKQHRSLTNS